MEVLETTDHPNQRLAYNCTSRSTTGKRLPQYPV
jgi:hypothetical protein